ncbi:SpoIIE family protein phosphatase [Leptospira sp. 2 VSF19]|uniref:SpoIIE family protein phosphatase n=1 Tax=Leptospira soteropolitanensis TaxID=2950025 RepID=A0AAW5VMI5_9LEPT|nr:SpoIIE family protein phosphatase [Leptospira soteropolitanensis]MCW7493834.1 SpoIIE family protein phosphatase [Leptospira soteropolitanensis]MCW7501429.1 SpoIIE family protein phosphatase [Leptospira soteropolitanensis]MCW7523808.1 SpoIIE family protein phosphatase [Leptospira soteropolitanensis]MCW7527673.1 SpoIIE family protein phosphatase [Leptospira soteropolitanensis]MCW7531526.1 SpoIIE family protein phosphatase [Leptospira soteropolitanensis]
MKKLSPTETLLFTLFSVFFFTIPVLSESPNDIGERILKTTKFTYWIDPTSSVPVASVLKTGEFKKITDDFVNIGFLKGTLWLRFDPKDFPDPAKYPLLLIQAHNIDSVELYHKHEGNTYVVSKSGHIQPVFQREIPHRNFVFRIGHERDTILIAIHSEISLQFSLIFTNQRNLQREDYITQWIYGLFFGSLGIIILYNLAIAFFVRDRNYFYYIGYVLFFGLGQLSLLGFWGYFFVPDSYFWKRIGIPFFFSICLFFFVLFTSNFLKLKARIPKMARCFQVLGISSLFNAIISLFGGISEASIGVTWLSLLICICLLGILIWGIYNRLRSFYYFAVAFVLLLITCIVYGLLKFGILPSNPFLEEMLFPIASLADITLFAFALADRIQLLRQEKDLALAQVTSLRKERKISRDILMQSLPKTIPDVKNLQMQIFIQPMKDVGGDFYEYFSPNPYELGIVLCDVSGHGIPASLISAMGKVAFTTQKDNISSPKQVLEGMNRVLYGNCNPQYVTASYVYLNTSTKVWRFGRAGHPSAYLQRADGEIIKVHPKGKIIGVFPEIQIEEITYKVEPKDRILILSDGVLECFNPDGSMYGETGLLEFLRANREIPNHLFKIKLIQDLKSFSKTEIKDWDDDLTFIFLELA